MPSNSENFPMMAEWQNRIIIDSEVIAVLATLDLVHLGCPEQNSFRVGRGIMGHFGKFLSSG